MQISVITESFRVPFKEAVKKAESIGATGIQTYAVFGELQPENLNISQRKEVLSYVKQNGLIFSALCADFGGFCDISKNKEAVAKTKLIMELAVDLDTNIVTTHIGHIPDDVNDPIFKGAVEALEEVGAYGDKIGVSLACETGQETAEVLKKFLDSLKTHSVKVNMDPANLAMCQRDDPVQAVYTLKDYIVHTHAKDGIYLGKNSYKEVPLGQGSVIFPEYLKALKDIGYDYFLTIEREVGDNPEADIIQAAEFLRMQLKNL